MSTQIIQANKAMLVIKRITDFTVNHQSGFDNIPHLCIKIQHGNGFAWFGLNVIPMMDIDVFSSSEQESLKNNIISALNRLTDIVKIETDMDRLMSNVSDIITHNQAACIYGNQNSNDYIYIDGKHNIQLEIYRDVVDESSSSFGGYKGYVIINNDKYPFLLFHKSVILNNYISMKDAEDFVVRTLVGTFGNIACFNISNKDVVTEDIVERTRNTFIK